MKKILIGSQALKHWFPDFKRTPKDTDYAVNEECKSGELGVECLYNPVLFKYFTQEILSPDLLLTLKMSHLFWEYNFDKHLFDTQYLLKKGCKYDLNILLELRAFWEEYLPKVRRSNLESSKDEFFTNAVNFDTDQHDYLHTIINPIPMYSHILKDGAEVELDEQKWNNLSFEDKCSVTTEETTVMFVERYKNSQYDKHNYVRQLKENIQRHFPIYIAIFAIENYPKLERLPSYPIESLREALNTANIAKN